MKRITPALAAVLLLCALAPRPATAQLGKIIDMIQRMSGPQMDYYGVVYRWGYQAGQELDAAEAEGTYATIEESLSPFRDRSRHGVVGDALACLGTTRALLEQRGSDYYEEGAVDRLRTNENRLLDRLGELRGQEDRTDDALLPTFQQIRDYACAQPEILARAERDPKRGFTWRVGLSYGHDHVEPEPGADIRGVLAQLTGEYRVSGLTDKGFDLGLEAGVAAHYFFYGGDGFESFVHPAFPVRVSVHPFARCSGWLIRNIRAGGGVHVVPPFPAAAFGGLYEQNDWEAPLAGFVSIDFSAGSLSSPALGC